MPVGCGDMIPNGTIAARPLKIFRPRRSEVLFPVIGLCPENDPVGLVDPMRVLNTVRYC
jgi:hypothetical protein